MSNYVYNRVLCNKEVKNIIEENKLFIKYDYIYKKQKDNTYELKFNTKEIQNNNIIKIITDYEDTKWFLIEENFTEEHYYYKNNEIKLDIRKLNTNDENIIFDNTCFDTYYEFKYYSLSIYNKPKDNLIIDDYTLNKEITYTLPKKEINKIKKISTDFVNILDNDAFYYPIKNIHQKEELTFFTNDNYNTIFSHQKGEYFNNEFIDITNCLLEIKDKINTILLNNHIKNKYLIKGSYLPIKDKEKDKLDRLISSIDSKLTNYIANLINKNPNFDLERLICFLNTNINITPDMLKEEAILCTKPKQNKKYRYVYVEYEDLKDTKLYCYLDTKKVVKKNDRVIVDRAGQNIGAKVINIVEYDPNEVPYPVEKTKKIIKIIDKDFIIEKHTNYEEYDTIYDYYKNMESLFDKIKNNIEKNGFLSDKFTLEPYLIDNKLSNYPDGEIDNIMPSFKNDEFIKFMKELFNELNDDNINEKVHLTDQYIYENNEVRAIGNIDILIDYLRENEKQIEPKNTYIYALYLIFTAKHPETLKIGISLLSLFPIDKDDNIVKDLEQISLCEEFTKFTNFVFNNIETSNEIRFKLAKKTKAWGKISLVKDLIPENNNIKDWLITNGVTNDIDNSYLAYPITRKIDIINELNNKNLYEEQLIGISKIIDALLNDRIYEYENKEELFTTYFNINYKFYNNISYNLTLLNILEYLNYNRISITLRKNITKYFKNQKVLTIIENNLYNQNFESSCLILYKLNNNNYNEIIYNKLKNNNLILPNAIRLLLKDKKYYQKTINIINNYDLSKYYGKPLPHILKDDNNLNNLLKLINIIEIYPFLTEKIIIDGLKCQYANIRLSTLNTLIKWLKLSNKKYKHLSNNLKDVLIELYNNEQVKQIKEELNKLIELKDDLSSFKDNKIKIIKNYKIFDLYKDNLKELFTDLIIERGKEYYNDDMIYNVVKTKDKYTLYVQGSTFDKEYIVTIRYEDSKLISMYCNCPYENNCKHECASIIYIREHNNKN